MNWKLRFAALKIFASVKPGLRCYQLLQKHFGDFNDAECIFSRLEEQIDLIDFIRRNGASIRNMDILEIGSGWVPLAPVILSICGARAITSVDKNKYYMPGLLRKVINIILDNKNVFIQKLSGSIPINDIEAGINLIDKFKDSPDELLKKMNIQLLSPFDARSTSFNNNQFDIIYSINTLEHVDREDIRLITEEAARIIRPGGVFAHLIDPADHFSYTDKNIPAINFLKLSGDSWNRYCNILTNHNRLRDSDYIDIFLMSDFKITGHEYEIDNESLKLLQCGFTISDEFAKYDYRELSKIKLKYLLKMK